MNKKNILYIVSTLVVLSTFVMNLLGKIDLSTAGLTITTTLGFLYGISQKDKRDYIENETGLILMESEELKDLNKAINETNKDLQSSLLGLNERYEFLRTTMINESDKTVEVKEDDIKPSKPKRVYKKKTK